MKQVNHNIKKIREAVDAGKLVMFVGAGVSMNSKLPSWFKLIQKFSKSLGIETNSHMTSDDYLRIAQYYYNERGRKEYYDEIYNIFDKKCEPNLIHEKILNLNPKHIITTNYDDLIEQAIEKSNLYYDVICEDKDLPYAQNNRLLIKMHGDLKRKNIVLKEDDYLSYSNQFKLIETYLKALFVNNTIVFVGYSLQDINLKIIIKWLKDVLGEDFQKAYILDSEDNQKSQVEMNYYKNLGINIISVVDITEAFQKREIVSLDDNRGKNIVRCIDYILEYEGNIDDVIDYFYEKLLPLEEFRKLRLKDIFHVMGLNFGYNLKGSDCILKTEFNNEDFYDANIFTTLIKKIKDADEIGKVEKRVTKKVEYLKKVMNRAGIENIDITIRKNNGDEKICYKFPLDIGELELFNTLKFNNYIGIENYAKQTFKSITVFRNKYYNELLRAYSNYLLKRYVSAYEILNNLSRKAFRDKEYTIFYICEFNKQDLVKYLKSSLYSFSNLLGEEAYIEHIKMIISNSNTENNESDLIEIFYSLPKKDRDIVSFLNDILFNNNYLYSRKIDADNLKEKIKEDVDKTYIGGDPYKMSNMPEYKRQVKEFWECTHNYFLMIDEYRDVKEYYTEYIETLLRTYDRSQKIDDKEEDEDWLFGGIEGSEMPLHEFDKFELFLMSKYVEPKKLRKMIEQYNIKTIRTKIPLVYLEGMFKNIISSYNIIENKKMLLNSFINMIYIISIIHFKGSDKLKVFIDNIINFISNNHTDLEIYRAIDYFIVQQYKKDETIIKDEFLKKIIIVFVKKINNSQYNNGGNGGELETLNNSNLIRNLSYLVKRADGCLTVEEVNINSLIDKSRFGEFKSQSSKILRRLFIEMYNLFDKNIQFKIQNWVTDELNNKFSTSLYAEARIRDIIESNYELEKKFYESIDKIIQEQEKTNGRSFPDPVKTQIGYLTNLVYNKKLNDIEALKKYKNKDNLFDLILSIEDFDFEKFKLNWLLSLNEEFIVKLKSSNRAKDNIKSKFIKAIINDDLNKELKEIYFKHFQ
ncbi:SIR2 family protein [Oceanirhabdus sp. W0125-5]|uniref:SIR2 family protein n=1 Tax=Oceanirhabdus sp. W0125-5 TaxID=2999116 RepID=UPI0022F33B7C|nr:SIR2 family protein [Oceanirhabdus sp. W0125-5]WBW98086.1 SIR2 family protein [Oceanirhabdus sp. W0125-5]